MLNTAILDMSPRLDQFEPSQAMQRLAGAGDRGLDRVIDALRGGADDLGSGPIKLLAGTAIG